MLLSDADAGIRGRQVSSPFPFFIPRPQIHTHQSFHYSRQICRRWAMPISLRCLRQLSICSRSRSFQSGRFFRGLSGRCVCRLRAPLHRYRSRWIDHHTCSSRCVVWTRYDKGNDLTRWIHGDQLDLCKSGMYGEDREGFERFDRSHAQGVECERGYETSK
jgi:hypothetical protein